MEWDPLPETVCRMDAASERDSEKDAVIYDLKDKSIILGDLFMLNH